MSQNNTNASIFVLFYLFSTLGGVLLHIWTALTIYSIHGLFAGFIALLFPFIAEIYCFFKIGLEYSFFDNFYCLSIIAYVAIHIFFLFKISTEPK